MNIFEYCRNLKIAVSQKETMRLMGEVDEVIESHGGWPIE